MTPCLLLFRDGARWLRFVSPSRVLECHHPSEVVPLLRELDRAVEHDGHHAAGYLSYEAAAGLGLPCQTPASHGAPLAWFGLFAPPARVDLPLPDGASSSGPWVAALDADRYALAIGSVLEHIARGDTYEVNFTFPLRGPVAGDPFDLFARLHAAHRGDHAAYLDTGRYVVASASPELFFERTGSSVVVCPMKGTARRGLTAEDDEARASALRSSAKDRAENVMIVDMMRNDLGRVAETGSVEVTSLFDVAAYPTLFQMVSTVRAETAASTGQIIEALFPSASVTGAPRRRTMEIIAALEPSPRGVYAGAIGWMAPGRRARFSVAIRSVVVDRERGEAVYGTGSGIVADSTARSEYAECLLKTRVLEEEPFSLLEALRFEPGSGLLHVEAHLARLMASARRFSVPIDPAAVRDAVLVATRDAARTAKVRLEVDGGGRIRTEIWPLESGDPCPVRVGLAREAVSSEEIWLRHKTTHRETYVRALRSRPDCDDVVLWNERGEITESTVANVIVEASGELLTPPLDAGLLPGILRAELVQEGRVREASVSRSDLEAAPRIWLVSAVRGWREVVLVP